MASASTNPKNCRASPLSERNAPHPQKDGQGGKRLAFMMQGLNREANTLGGKASVKELASASMELKLLIEKMREQVQNVE
jgi:uncharacterized protein (TIGR00255 family)